MIFLLVLCAFILFVISSWIYLLRDAKRCKIPGPTPFPVIGNGNIFLCDSNQFLERLSNMSIQYGDAYRVHIMTDRFFLLSHPKYIEQLISSTETITKGLSYSFLRPWLGDGLLTSTGLKWKSHRKFLTPAFHYNILHTFLPVFLKNDKILCEKLNEYANGSPIEIFPIVAKAALDNIAETIMGVPLYAQLEKESKYVEAIDIVGLLKMPRIKYCFMKTCKNNISVSPGKQFFSVPATNKVEGFAAADLECLDHSHVMHPRGEILFAKITCIASQIMATRMRDVFLGNDMIFALTPYKRRQDKAIEFMHKHTKEVIEARRKELNKVNAVKLDEKSEIGLKNKHAFLDLLLLAEVDGQGISGECVRDEVITFMFEGHDTTASGLVYGLYCIAKYPEVQRKILEEQKSILGENLERDPTFSELQQMKYLECVIKECLRLFPSVPLIQRQITKDIEMSGMFFPKNTIVVINIFQMHRNPAVFEDPLEFRPERFETNNMKNPFSWIAFSAGPRNCIGQKFAMLEMKVTLAAIVNRFKLLPSNQDPEPCGDLILRSKNGVHVRFLRRDLKA